MNKAIEIRLLATLEAYRLHGRASRQPFSLPDNFANNYDISPREVSPLRGRYTAMHRGIIRYAIGDYDDGKIKGE